MATSPVTFLAILNAIYLVSSNLNIDCTTIEGDNSGNDDGDLSIVTCTTNYPTMVSCGFRTKDSTEKDFEGSWIDTSSSTHKCVARNANAGAGVYAYARCWYICIISTQTISFDILTHFYSLHLLTIQSKYCIVAMLKFPNI